MSNNIVVVYIPAIVIDAMVADYIPLTELDNVVYYALKYSMGLYHDYDVDVDNYITSEYNKVTDKACAKDNLMEAIEYWSTSIITAVITNHLCEPYIVNYNKSFIVLSDMY